MELLDIITEKVCSVSLEAKTKNEAIEDIAKFLKENSEDRLNNLTTEELAKALKDREELGSTGFGDGIAIPHCKLDNIEHFSMALLISKKGINFDSLDGKKANIFFVIIAPSNQADSHIKFLAAVSRIVKHKNVRKELIASETPLALYEAFAMQIEPSRASKTPKKKKKQKLIMIVLYESYLLDDVLEYFLEIGIEGSTVIDSIGMGGILTKVPLFANFIDFLGSNKNYSKTIFLVIPEDMVEKIVDGIEEILGDLDKRSGAMIIALDVSFIKGSMEYL